MPMGSRQEAVYNKAGAQTGTTTVDDRYKKTRRRASSTTGKKSVLGRPMGRENRFTVTDASGRRGRRRSGKTSSPTLMEALMMGGVLK